MARHDLSIRPCTVLGREQDDVHIWLAHESCSRKHARIAFAKTNQGTDCCWLRDLASAHGTLVNKKRFPAQACGKTEVSASTQTGARGVLIYPGDVLQFGASTRLFTVQGPDEASREAIQVQAKLATVARKTATTTSTSEEELASNENKQEEGIISWGISMEEEDTATSTDAPESDSDVSAWLQSNKLPEQHATGWQRIQAIHQKIANMQLESERIRMKGNELTAGQTLQLERNEKRISELQVKVHERERELYSKLNPTQAAGNRKRNHRQHDYVVEEDVEDRTRSKKDDTNTDGETEESLRHQYKEAYQRRQRLHRELEHSEQRRIKLQQRVDDAKQSADTGDAFFLENDLTMATETCRKVASQIESIELSMKDLKQLLLVANPSLFINLSSGYVGMEPEEDAAMAPPPPPNEWSMAPPPPMIKATVPPKEGNDDDNGMAPPPVKKRTRVVGPNAAQPSRKSPQVICSTMSAISSAFASSGDTKMKDNTANNSKFSPAITNKVADVNVDTWQAPKDQDGSGRTKLNDKFAGRY